MKTLFPPYFVRLWLPMASVLWSGCTALPEAAPPRLDTVLSPSYHHADMTRRDAEYLQWWSTFNDPALSALIDKVLGSNHDVKIALTRIRAARAGADAQNSRLWPTIDLKSSLSSERTTLPTRYKQGMPDVQAAQVGIGVAWEIDLGGGVRAAADAAHSEALISEYAAEGTRLLIASETAREYFILRGAQRRIDLLRELADNRHRRASLIKRRFDEGEGSRIELDLAEAEADALEAQIPTMQTLLDVTQSRLAILTGENPSLEAVRNDPQYVWPKSPEIGTGQPIDLLRRRPDLMAAEAHYRAQTLRAAEAASQRWPKIFLNALIGSEDLRINGANLAPIALSNVGLMFALPVFNAGRIRAGIDAESAREREALLSWQKGVVVAVKEVEDSLSRRSGEMRRGEVLRGYVGNLRNALLRSESLYREGEIGKPALYDAKRSVLGGEIDLADHETQRLLADVDLYKALGGGWNIPKTSLDGDEKEIR